MRNNIGFYVGFSLFAIQTIVGDFYRDNKQQQHNNKMKTLLSEKSKQRAWCSSRASSGCGWNLSECGSDIIEL